MKRCSLFALMICMAVLVHQTDAQVVPFRVNGSGDTFDQGLSLIGVPGPHNATGNGTSLGKYIGDEGVFQSLSFDPSTGSGTFQGRFVFAKRNGDRLVCSYGDQSNGAAEAGDYFAVTDEGGLSRIVFCAEFNPIVDECTGRFKNLIGGSFIMLAISEPFLLEIDKDFNTPPFQYSWEGIGHLEYARGR